MDSKIIIIDAFQHSPAITGTDRMAYNFLKYLQKIDSKNKYIIICSKEDYIPSVINKTNFSCISPRYSSLNNIYSRIYSAFWRRLIIIRLKIIGADTYMSFHNMRTPLLKISKKTVMFNLDLIPLVLNDYKKINIFGNNKVKKYYEKSVQKASNIVCISNYSEKELISNFPLSEGKTQVIHLASDEKFRPIKFTDKDNFMLTIGGSETRKNVSKVIEAYELLPNKLKDKFKLVITGTDWRNKKLDTSSNNIKFQGFVSDNKLYSLYQKSSLFVFASSYEGFGFSILEAMKSGTPVLTNEATSLPEVGGDAVSYFNVNNINSLAVKMEEILNSEKIRKKMVENGMLQASKFSWLKSASELKELLIS